MARIRSIKPEFWTSEQVVTCSPLARLLFVGLWTFCDDGGVHPASVRRLKMEVFPADAFDDAAIGGLLVELVNAGLVREYEANGERFWFVTGWPRHQRIDKPTFRHPPPPDATENPSAIRRMLGEDSTNARREVADASPPEWSGVGVERNGIGVESERNELSPHGDDIAATDSPSSTGTLAADKAPTETTTTRPQSQRDKRTAKFDAEDLQLAHDMFDGIRAIHPEARPPDFDRWANAMRLLRADGRDRTPAQIRATLAWVRQHTFWNPNVLSPEKLRQHWDRLQVQFREETRNAQPRTTGTAKANDGTYRPANGRRASF